MITALRHLFVDSWLGRLMALLTFFAFVVWGGNSIFNLSTGTSEDALVSVGDEVVKASDFERLLDLRQKILADKFQNAKWIYSQESVAQLGQVTLSSMVNSLASMQAAKSAGFIVSDERVRERVFSDPQFKGEDGNFDPVKMNMLLQANGQTHEDLIKQVRQELYEEAVLEGLGNSVQSSKVISDYLSRYFGRSYQIDAVHFSVNMSDASSMTPKEAQLKRFYLNHASLFRVPEYRHITVAVLTKEKAASSIEVSSEMLHRLYDERQHLYNVPQTRDVNILTFKNEKEARECKKHWHKGLSWQKLSQVCSEGVSASLSKARKSDIPSDHLAETVFTAQVNVLEGPISLDRQFAILLVDNVYAPKNRSFEEVRPELTKEIQVSGTAEAFRQKLGEFEEAIAGTGNLNKLSPKLGLEIFSATLDSEGKTPANREVVIPGGATLQKEILREAFVHKQGDMPQVISNDERAYAISVDETSPARLQEFQEIKEDVIQKWREAEALHLSEVQATNLLQDAKTHSLKQSLDQSGIKGGEYRKDLTVSRMKSSSGISNRLANRILTSDSEKVVMDQDGSEFWIVKITKIVPLPSQEESKMSSDLQQKATESLRGDITENLGRFYIGKYQPKNFNVKRYQEIISHFVR
ncbi:hypothetical protein FAI41_01005 [Acetobacteraceae bacterium]|nr:hypothetical protein FAI41_01005 [Acetobacteraceae bacterium]